jgi:hypothetical protein
MTDDTTHSTLIELTATSDAPTPRQRGPRRMTYDPLLEARLADRSPVKLFVQRVTRGQLITRTETTDSGEEFQTGQYVENAAFLITVIGWDLVEDKATFKRKRIIPAVRDANAADRSKAVLIQYADHKGTVMEDNPTVLKKD